MGSSYKNVSPRRSLVLIEEPCNDWLNILNAYDICKNKNQTPYGAAHKRLRHTRARFRDALISKKCSFLNIVQKAFDPPPLLFEHLSYFAGGVLRVFEDMKYM